MKKAFRKIHLWLGLISGIVVFIVCITGALYVFKDEVQAITQPWRSVKPMKRPFIPESKLILLADKATGLHASAITTGSEGDAAWVDYFTKDGRQTVYLNPYTAEILHVDHIHAGDFDFFSFILNGHRHLWLPEEIGTKIVSYGTLLFLIELITGLLIWIPRKMNRKSMKRMFTFHRPLHMRRFIFDLHAVAGLYLLLPLMVLCMSGMLFGLTCFAQGAYSILSGGKAMESYALPASDTMTTHEPAPIDRLAHIIHKQEPHAVQFYYALPQIPADVYRVSIVHERGSYYKQDNRYFDQYSLAELKGKGPWAGRYDEVSTADRMMRMNLDIHSGRIIGFPSKMLMFLASLLGASLPVTGLLLWKRKKQKTKIGI